MLATEGMTDVLLAALRSSAMQLGHSNWGRLLITAAVLMAGLLLLKRLHRATSNGRGTLAERRERYVWMRNLLVVAGFFTVAMLWASSLAGAALSLAAVTGALLIVSKEFLANLFGHLYFLLTRPFGVGDFVEVAGIRGRLTDVHVLAITLTETLEGNQLTGRTVTLPSSILLTTPARNISATGVYSIQLLHVAADPKSDLLATEEALLEAARLECEPWQDEAKAHLQSIESRRLLDLPSAEPRVLLELRDSKTAVLSLRFVCQTESRVGVQQAILRRFLRSGAYTPATPTS